MDDNINKYIPDLHRRPSGETATRRAKPKSDAGDEASVRQRRIKPLQLVSELADESDPPQD